MTDKCRCVYLEGVISQERDAHRRLLDAQKKRTEAAEAEVARLKEVLEDEGIYAGSVTFTREEHAKLLEVIAKPVTRTSERDILGHAPECIRTARWHPLEGRYVDVSCTCGALPKSGTP